MEGVSEFDLRPSLECLRITKQAPAVEFYKPIEVNMQLEEESINVSEDFNQFVDDELVNEEFTVRRPLFKRDELLPPTSSSTAFHGRRNS